MGTDIFYTIQRRLATCWGYWVAHAGGLVWSSRQSPGLLFSEDGRDTATGDLATWHGATTWYSTVQYSTVQYRGPGHIAHRPMVTTHCDLPSVYTGDEPWYHWYHIRTQAQGCNVSSKYQHCSGVLQEMCSECWRWWRCGGSMCWMVTWDLL